MKLLLDTNILVAAVTQDTGRPDIAIELLNEANDTHVSVLTSRGTATLPGASDVMAAN